MILPLILLVWFHFFFRSLFLFFITFSCAIMTKQSCVVPFSAYRPPTSGINILTNPGFEQPLVNDPIKGWSCQGETDDPRGGFIARYSRQRPKEGKHSGICLARLSEWAGPGQYVGKSSYTTKTSLFSFATLYLKLCI